MLHNEFSTREPSRRSCSLTALGEAVDLVGAGGHEAATIDWLTAISDITGALSSPFDASGPEVLPVELSEVLASLARAATRRLDRHRVTYVLPDAAGPPPVLGDPPVPDVCVPVTAPDAAAGVVGHLHLSCGTGRSPTTTDRAALEFLAGYGAELSVSRRRERSLREAARQPQDP